MVRFGSIKSNNAVAEKPKKGKVKKEKVKAIEELVENFPKGMRYEARCLKDKEAVIVSEGRLVKINGKLAVRGIHKSCGTTVFSFTSQAKYDAAKKATGKANG